jgi:signal transduction histidine kinase
LAATGQAHLGLGPIIATYAVACWSGVIVRRVAAVSLALAVWLVPVQTNDLADVPRNAALFAAAWILGALMRERSITHASLEQQAADLRRERETNALLATEMERARIARELHDVLAHSVSTIIVQAQAGQTSGDSTEPAKRALARIEAIGKETLSELRVLLRRVRANDEPASRTPQPGLARLDELLSEVRAAGVDVSYAQDGETRAIPPSVGLSAYRIVQEALTNTMRHTVGGAVQVLVHYLPGELRIEVLDEGPCIVEQRSRGGHGLNGMRERASLVGGSLLAEPRPGGGFKVTARLPLEVLA